MRSTHLVRALTTATLIAGLAACSNGGPRAAVTPTASTAATSGSTAAASPKIVISNFHFQMAHMSVKPGQTITVVNSDSTPHTVTASSGHAFDTGTIAGGKTASFTAPTKPGEYPYICTIHQFMRGTLTVR